MADPHSWADAEHQLNAAKSMLQRLLTWESTDFEDDEKREYALCGLADDTYKLLHPDATLSPRDEDETPQSDAKGEPK